MEDNLVWKLISYFFQIYESYENKFPTKISSCTVHVQKPLVQNQIVLTHILKAGPLEAILVIFGRRALIFFFWKLLEKYEKWHHFRAHAQWSSPWRRKNVDKGHLAPSNLTFFINCDRQKRFSQNERRRADLQNTASDFLNFCLGTSLWSFKFSDDFTPFFFFNFKRP